MSFNGVGDCGFTPGFSQLQSETGGHVIFAGQVGHEDNRVPTPEIKTCFATWIAHLDFFRTLVHAVVCGVQR
jgi:hypothetical protein